MTATCKAVTDPLGNFVGDLHFKLGLLHAAKCLICVHTKKNDCPQRRACFQACTRSISDTDVAAMEALDPHLKVGGQLFSEKAKRLLEFAAVVLNFPFVNNPCRHAYEAAQY